MTIKTVEMDESKLLDMFIQQMKPPILDDLISDESPVFAETSNENCARITTKFSIHDRVAYKL